MLKYLSICFFLALSFQNTVTAESKQSNLNSVKIFNGDFDTALKHASANGKLLLVDFYADWCTPCRWMDNTTFADNNVTQVLNDNYVVYKADIDEPTGFNAKEKFNVKVLPTLLIFNTKGELQERIEETMTPDQLLPILDFHNNPNNTLKITHQINKSPQQSMEQFQDMQDLQIMYEEYKRREKVKSNYRLQIGIYDDYQSAFKRVNKLRETFLEEIIVLNDFRSGTTIYKVMMGQFQTLNEAESFRKILASHFQIDAIVH